MSPDSEAFSNVSVFENEGFRFRSLQCGREVKTYRKRCVFKWTRISVVQAIVTGHCCVLCDASQGSLSLGISNIMNPTSRSEMGKFNRLRKVNFLLSYMISTIKVKRKGVQTREGDQNALVTWIGVPNPLRHKFPYDVYFRRSGPDLKTCGLRLFAAGPVSLG